MNVVFSTPDGPLEGFTEAEFRVAINDDGVGRLTAPPEVVDSITGPITCSVAGFPVFRWSIEERNENYADDDSSTVNGRGRTGALDRAIVLPVGYPNYTDRTRTEQGSPFGIWADLLAEAQGRNRVTDITPTWTATHDTNGQPWKETIDIQLEPGTNLRSLLANVTEVEGAEWFLQPNGELDAATTLGDDLSGEVVLFVSRHQVSRNRRLSSRDQRQTVYIEASTGVSEATNTLPDDAGEIWLEAQDYADVLSRQAIADKLAEKLDDPQEEVDIVVSADCGIFDTFTVGDRIGLDTGSGTIQTVRVVGALITVTDTIEVELTLISEVALRQQKIDRAIEAKADVQLAASPAIQRRHGLVTADKFLSGAVGSQVAIASENYIPAIPGPGQGWAILGNGNAEFNDAIFRGDLQSDNYVPNVSGWSLTRAGFAEFENGLFRGTITGSTITGSTLTTATTGARLSLSSDRMTIFDANNAAVGELSAVATLNRVDLLTSATGQILLGRSGGGFISLNAAGNWQISNATTGWSIDASGNFFSREQLVFRQVFVADTPGSSGAKVMGVLGGRFFVSDGSVERFSVESTGAMTAAGATFNAGTRTFGEIRGTTLRSDTTLRVDGTSDMRDNVQFRNTGSGRRFTMNDAFVGGSGSEPTLDTSASNFGAIGLSTRPIWRGWANSWVSTSVRGNKGEVVDCDLADAYQKVKDLPLYTYSLTRSRDDYYTAKGEWMLGELEEFDDPGGPLRRFGTMADEAPVEVTDGDATGIDSYALASLVAAAVKHLQDKVERLEEVIDGG